MSESTFRMKEEVLKEELSNDLKDYVRLMYRDKGLIKEYATHVRSRDTEGYVGGCFHLDKDAAIHCYNERIKGQPQCCFRKD